MGKRGPKPRTIIDTMWRPELAYAVGLLASDGCLLGDGRHIDFTSKDRDLIEQFRAILGLHHVKIGIKVHDITPSRRYFRVQFGNVAFYRWLRTVGLTPKKSTTIAALGVPERYFFDFFRGLFDGDGSIVASWDKRWASSYSYYLTIASASPAFLQWLQERVEELLKLTGIVHVGVRVKEVRYAKRATRALVASMYHDPRSPRSARKFAKIQNIFSIDDEHARVV